MKRVGLCVGLMLAVAGDSFAGLGIMDTVNETLAKTGASSLGVLDVYDHPADVSKGQFYVPVQYNRTNAEGNGAEFDPNTSTKTDIDYIPLSQMKGMQGAQGVQGTEGTAGARGVQGQTGQKGNDGKDGKDGKDGHDGTDANINNNLFLNIGSDVRWYDWKHVALHSGYRYDVRHFNHTVDIAVIHVKLGRSYEEREIEKLKKLLGVR